MPDVLPPPSTPTQRALKWTIFLGATAFVVYLCVRILAPFLKPDPDAYLFSPREAREERFAAMRACRKTSGASKRSGPDHRDAQTVQLFMPQDERAAQRRFSRMCNTLRRMALTAQRNCTCER